MAAKKNLKESRGRKWSEVELRSTFMRSVFIPDSFNVSDVKCVSTTLTSLAFIRFLFVSVLITIPDLEQEREIKRQISLLSCQIVVQPLYLVM